MSIHYTHSLKLIIMHFHSGEETYLTPPETDSKRHQFLTHTYTLYLRKITAW